MTEQSIVALIAKIDSYYPNRLPKDEQSLRGIISSYMDVLHDVDPNKVYDNLMYHVKNNIHPPTIADLLGNTKQKDEYRVPVPNALDTRNSQLWIEQQKADKQVIDDALKAIEKGIAEGKEYAKRKFINPFN